MIDATNLDGFFKVMLNLTPDNPAVESDGSAPLLPKAVQEQLGLRLVVSKEPIKVLVVDHVDDQPTPN